VRLDRLLGDVSPDWVIVQGDTTSVMAASLASFNRGARVAHVEAGLRTSLLRNPFPEEMNRRVADLDWADGPALRLDRRAACPGDGARDSTSQLEVVVRGVDDGIDILSGEIALLDLNGKAVDAPAHAVG